MAMVYNSIFKNLVPSINKLTYSPPTSHSIQYHNNLYTQKRQFPLPKVASIPYPPINVDYLETEFSGHGVSFSTIGESCVVAMRLDNGSLATLMLPSGLVTSYKAPMWHGGLLELLHTAVSTAEDGGGAVVRGGVSLALKCEGDDENGGFSWAPTSWALSNVRGNPQESIQVELISCNSDQKVKVKHIVSLQQDTISSEVLLTNLTPSPLHFMGSIVGHLAVSTPEATYAVGLENSNYFKKPPFLSNFCIIPSDFDKKDSKNSWGSMSFMELFSSWSSRNPNNGGNEEQTMNEEEEMEGEEDDNYKHLTEKFSMIYTSAPRNFTIIDRGKRNSVVVGREGFNELYMMSPGSSHKAYGKYSYICIGQAALLEPLTLGPGAQWRGVQHLHNPNL